MSEWNQSLHPTITQPSMNDQGPLPGGAAALHVEIRWQFCYLLKLVRGFFASLLIAHKFGSFFLLRRCAEMR